MRKWLILLCLVLAAPMSALAASDIVATYVYSDGTMVTLCTRDKSHVRMDTSPTTYTLLSNGKVYSVNCESGQCQAMDMGAMMGAMNSGGFSSMFGGDDEAGGDPEYDVRYKKTGRTENVAGYKGVVYEAEVYEQGKLTSREEMVLSNHSNIKKLTEGWIAMAEVMTQAMGDSFEGSLEEAKKLGYGGMLRYGDSMKLSKLTVKNLNASYYKLPSGTQQMQAQQPPQPTQQPQPTHQSSNDSAVEQDAKEIGNSARQDTKNEIKDAIGGAISDLFN